MVLVKPIIKRLKRSSIFCFFFNNFSYFVLRLLFYSYRIEVACAPETVKYLHEGNGIFYFWHQQIIAGMFFFFKYNAQGACIVSPSADGKIVGFICNKLGFNVLYGSSYKSSISVTRKALATLKESGRLCLVGDGSRGPAFQLQSGLSYLSAKSNRPLIFVECKPEKALTFNKSWDRFQLPLPLSKIYVKIHAPVYVDLSKAT